MDNPKIKKALTALSRAAPKGWEVVGIMPDKSLVDYRNKRTKKHRAMGFVDIEGGLRVTGEKKVIDVLFD